VAQPGRTRLDLLAWMSAHAADRYARRAADQPVRQDSGRPERVREGLKVDPGPAPQNIRFHRVQATSLVDVLVVAVAVATAGYGSPVTWVQRLNPACDPSAPPDALELLADDPNQTGQDRFSHKSATA
jgi:hypothetical protein